MTSLRAGEVCVCVVFFFPCVNDVCVHLGGFGVAGQTAHTQVYFGESEKQKRKCAVCVILP